MLNFAAATPTFFALLNLLNFIVYFINRIPYALSTAELYVYGPDAARRSTVVWLDAKNEGIELDKEGNKKESLFYRVVQLLFCILCGSTAAVRERNRVIFDSLIIRDDCMHMVEFMDGSRIVVYKDVESFFAPQRNALCIATLNDINGTDLTPLVNRYASSFTRANKITLSHFLIFVVKNGELDKAKLSMDSSLTAQIPTDLFELNVMDLADMKETVFGQADVLAF